MKKKRSTQPKATLVVILGIAAIVAVMFISNILARPVHCVTGAAGDKCFDNQAEAINYATGGQVNLPHDASQADIDAALRALDSQSS